MFQNCLQQGKEVGERAHFPLSPDPMGQELMHKYVISSDFIGPYLGNMGLGCASTKAELQLPHTVM